MVGGFASSTTRLNDLWLLDPATGSWSQPASVLETSRRIVQKSEAATQDDEASALNDSKRDYLDDLGGGGDAAQAGIAPVDGCEDAPTPRGAHTASLVEGSVWVFGGYGGSGFGRRDFSDVRRFDLGGGNEGGGASHGGAAESKSSGDDDAVGESSAGAAGGGIVIDDDLMAWVPVQQPDEEQPHPEGRSDHSSGSDRHRLIVYGGWNASRRFDDTWALDTRSMVWEKIDTALLGHAGWNASSVGVPAVPSWLIFSFGGSRAPMDEDGESKAEAGDESFSNELTMLNTAMKRWEPLVPEGKAPRARSDAGMAFDPIK